MLCNIFYSNTSYAGNATIQAHPADIGESVWKQTAAYHVFWIANITKNWSQRQNYCHNEHPERSASEKYLQNDPRKLQTRVQAN